jgi:hypothetical protein
MAVERIADTYWMGLHWGGWFDLRAQDRPRETLLPHGPAVYTVANVQAWDELLFIGYTWDMSDAYSSVVKDRVSCAVAHQRCMTH